MNAQMRRIDLLCKLLGPLFIALVDGFSTKIAIIVNFAMNVLSVGVEYLAIARVYWDAPELQHGKGRIRESQDSPRNFGFMHNWRHLKTAMAKSAGDLDMYFHHRAFLPSIAGALLYLTVLSFAGQMVTYLLSAGYSSTAIGVARTCSVGFEILATWVCPWLMSKIGPVRAGLWMSSWQATCLVAGVAVFWAFSNDSLVSASGLVVGTIVSRIGLRGVDMCTQLIVQEDVEAKNRGAFSTAEAAWQNAFELISYATTMIFFRPQEFRWPALISVMAVVCASSAYTLYVRLRRGHLVHFEAITTCMGMSKGKQRERDRLIERITSR
jgi:solute carrier family 40 (iron-regulated transporter), member 1